MSVEYGSPLSFPVPQKWFCNCSKFWFCFGSVSVPMICNDMCNSHTWGATFQCPNTFGLVIWSVRSELFHSKGAARHWHSNAFLNISAILLLSLFFLLHLLQLPSIALALLSVLFGGVHLRTPTLSRSLCPSWCFPPRCASSWTPCEEHAKKTPLLLILSGYCTVCVRVCVTERQCAWCVSSVQCVKLRQVASSCSS